ncbi:MAG: hypothetical protein HUJ58_08385, partial [Erysipelotrichaceae bacterium]|nr:hypothetical protein [Erysipelotrichaceae bacterium]
MSFLEEYRNLEMLCNQLYESDNGINDYIKNMKQCKKAKKLIPDWIDDLEALEDYRDIGKKVIKKKGVNEEKYADEEDIEWVVSFTKRILTKNDPISVYEKAMLAGQSEMLPKKKKTKEKPAKKIAAKPVKEITTEEVNEPAEETETEPLSVGGAIGWGFLGALAAMVFCGVALAVVYFLMKL